MSKLGLTLPMHQDELALGYFCRTAKLNHREPYYFADDLGMKFADIVNGDSKTFTRFADLTGTDVNLLNANCHRDGDDTNLLIRDQSLRRKSFVITRFRYCPCCVMDDMQCQTNQRFHASTYAIQRLHWSVLHLRSCPKHHVMICDEPALNNPSLDYDFTRKVAMLLARSNLQTASEPAVGGAFENYVHDRLAARIAEESWLDSLELGVAAQLCERLGIMAMRGVDAQISAFSEIELIEAANVGFEIASAGRNSVKQALIDADRPSDLEGQSKPQKVFGEFYKWVAFTARAEAYAPIKDLLREVAIENVPLRTDDTILGEPVGSRGRRLVVQIAKEVGVHPKRLRKLFDHQQMIDERVGIASVDYGAGIALAKKAKLGLNVADLIEYIGVDRVSAQVVAERYTSRIVDADLKSINGIIDRNSVDDFTARLTRDATPVTEKPDALETIPKASKKTNRFMHEIIDLILDGSLRRVFRLQNEKPFAAILVDPREIRSVSTGAPMGGMTITEIAWQYNISQKTVSKLLKHGCLKFTFGINPLNRCPQRVVDEKVAAEFFEAYVFNNHLADARDLTPNSMLQALQELGIEPAFNPNDVGTFIFTRASVASI